MGTPWAANAPLHPGGHETADSQCVELEVPLKMGHCAGQEDLRTVLSWSPTWLQTVVVGVGSAGFVAQNNVVVVLHKLEARVHVLMEAMRSGTRFIVAPTGGLKNIVEDDFTDLWTDGKMTVE
ncbi:unnamed protein product, partial [Symbiodinium sp. KB8]